MPKTASCPPSETALLLGDAGLDELIIPDFTLGPNAFQRTEQMDRFITEIAPEFR